ncbi:MAG: hypothetical protein DRI70_05935, partial [Bacteroidetes bacterium]
MIKNYFTSMVRALARNRMLTLINIGGLAIGFAAFFAIMAFTSFDLSYEDFMPAKEQIYRMEISYSSENGTQIHASAGPVSAKPVFLEEFPGLIDAATRFYIRSGVEVRNGEQVFIDDVMVTDSDFFRVFDLPFVAGGQETAFQTPGSMVLTESMAQKYFGDENPVGKTLDKYIVTGVIKNLPENTHLKPGLIVSADFPSMSWWEDYAQRWDINFMYTYLKFHPLADTQRVRSRFEHLVT